jgi:hypothetical protein
MMLPVNQPCIAPDDFEAFRTLIKSDSNFPATYERWLESRAKERDKARAQGNVVNMIDVHPQEFSDFCWDRNQPPSAYLLSVHAAIKGRQA